MGQINDALNNLQLSSNHGTKFYLQKPNYCQINAIAGREN